MGRLDSVTEFHALTQPLLDLFLNPANGLDSQFDWFRELIVLDIQVERRPWNTSEFTHARKSQYFHALHLEGVTYRAFASCQINSLSPAISDDLLLRKFFQTSRFPIHPLGHELISRSPRPCRPYKRPLRTSPFDSLNKTLQKAPNRSCTFTRMHLLCDLCTS